MITCIRSYCPPSCVVMHAGDYSYIFQFLVCSWLAIFVYRSSINFVVAINFSIFIYLYGMVVK